jgi:hypothetical protein
METTTVDVLNLPMVSVVSSELKRSVPNTVCAPRTVRLCLKEDILEFQLTAIRLGGR